MKTHWFIKHLNYIAFIAMFSTCGVDTTPRYGEDQKTFGLAKESKDHRVPVPNPSKEVNEAEETIVIPPDRLIFRSTFKGKMDPDSVRFLYGASGVTVKPKESVMYSLLESKINSLLQMEVNLIAEQTFGDGKHAQYTQYITSSIEKEKKDVDSLFKSTVDTGVQIYDRVLGRENCPKQLACIDRMRIYLNDERSVGYTYCFWDENDQVTSFPLGASPGVSADDLHGLEMILGPYKMIRYDAVDVVCRKTNLTPRKSIEIEVQTSVENDKKTLLRVAKNSDTQKIDFGIKVEYFRVVDGVAVSANSVPYMDMLTNLQARTIYYFNAVSKDLVLISKTARRELKDSYLTGRYYGAMVDVNFKLCKDLLIKGSKNHCEK